MRTKAEALSGKDNIIRWLLIAAGIIGVLDTIFVSTYSNYNAGIIMPALFGAPLLFIGLFYANCHAFFRLKKGRVLRDIIIFIYVGFGVCFFIALGFMISAPTVNTDTKVDVIYVLGAAVHGDTPSLTLTKRLDKAAEYLEANEKAICVVSGGRGTEENRAEGDVMYDYLIAKGVPPERVLAEDKARNTDENFALSKVLTDEYFGSKDYKNAFVTSEFHIYRAGKIAEKYGLSPDGLPVRSEWHYLPNSYLRECLAIWYMWLTGGGDM